MSRGILAALMALVAVTACRAEPWVELGGERFTVEIARTLQEQARGLMFREHLPAGRGMLFVYERAFPQRFWMKNTRIALDIMFFDGQRRLINVHTARPCRADPCPTYPSAAPARYVLELNAGKAEALGIKPGAELTLSPELRREEPE